MVWPVILPKHWWHNDPRAFQRFKVPSGVLGNEGGVIIRVNHDLCNGSHTTPKADQHADKAEKLQGTPLGGKLPHTCSTITWSYTTAIKHNFSIACMFC